MAKYVPSGRFSVFGLLWVFGLGGSLSWFVGSVMGVFSGLVWFFWIFPVAWGFVAGIAASAGIYLGKCRNLPIAVVSGIVCSLLSYGALHREKNDEFRSDLREKVIKEGRATEATADLAVDREVAQESGRGGFWGIFALRAKKGLIPPTRSVRKSPILWGWGAYAYWLVEYGVGMAIVIVATVYFSGLPFCETCRWWWWKDEDWELKGDPRALKEALAKRNFSRVSKFIARKKGADQFAIERCKKCERGPVRVTFRLSPDTAAGKSGDRKVEELLSEEEGRAFLAALPVPPPPPEPKAAGR